jgi:hypothetical protein
LEIRIDKAGLEQVCKDIIETILFCLPNAHKGTVYRIGGPPDMTATRITSGIMDRSTDTISWGLPETSGYNPPGKPWLEYRDNPNRPLEAMSWCVEKQKSWTSEDPENDIRNLRGKERGAPKDFHHMEPVLIRKEDLYNKNIQNREYPKNVKGETIWENNNYVVVAVIKIHFTPNSIRIGSPETKFIKRLSRAMGTHLLSFQLKQQSVEAMRQLAMDKLNSCNILADSLRNAITKSGLIFSLIKLEIGFLRGQWEEVLLEKSDQKRMKQRAVDSLNQSLMKIMKGHGDVQNDLTGIQNKFLEFSMAPEQGEQWIRMQVEERWNKLLHESPVGKVEEKAIRQNIEDLKRSLHLGKDPDLLKAYDKVPKSLKKELTELIYMNLDRVDFGFLERLIDILADPSLNLPNQEKSRKSLTRLKALAEIMYQLEKNTNLVLREVLNGYEEHLITKVLDRKNVASK